LGLIGVWHTLNTLVPKGYFLAPILKHSHVRQNFLSYVNEL
jgi:uncharacterized membrane protein YiaA